MISNATALFHISERLGCVLSAYPIVTSDAVFFLSSLLSSSYYYSALSLVKATPTIVGEAFIFYV